MRPAWHHLKNCLPRPRPPYPSKHEKPPMSSLPALAFSCADCAKVCCADTRILVVVLRLQHESGWMYSLCMSLFATQSCEHQNDHPLPYFKVASCAQHVQLTSVLLKRTLQAVRPSSGKSSNRRGHGSLFEPQWHVADHGVPGSKLPSQRSQRWTQKATGPVWKPSDHCHIGPLGPRGPCCIRLLGFSGDSTLDCSFRHPRIL